MVPVCRVFVVNQYWFVLFHRFLFYHYQFCDWFSFFHFFGLIKHHQQCLMFFVINLPHKHSFCCRGFGFGPWGFMDFITSLSGLVFLLEWWFVFSGSWFGKTYYFLLFYTIKPITVIISTVTISSVVRIP